LSAARLYAVFWGTPADFPADAYAGLEAVLKALDNSAYLAHLDQYFRGALTSAPYAATLFDPSTPPASEPTPAAVAAAACRALDASRITPADDGIYVVFSSSFPADMHGCAWHLWHFCHDVPILIALVPNAAADPGGCLRHGPDTGGSVSTATAVMQSFAVHEVIEMMTDPFPYQGWADPYSQEAGDKCGSDFAFTQVGTGTFWLQSIWSNADERCVR
jgi:hypothetical protein